jgi:hypothetical protein
VMISSCRPKMYSSKRWRIGVSISTLCVRGTSRCCTIPAETTSWYTERVLSRLKRSNLKMLSETIEVQENDMIWTGRCRRLTIPEKS